MGAQKLAPVYVARGAKSIDISVVTSGSKGRDRIAIGWTILPTQ
jgi:hypothetical protein